ncbi:hypothetical protein [Thermoleptolyngbya sp.]
MARHFGLPESKVLINGFIATVPAFIDACTKFWIFLLPNPLFALGLGDL